MRETLCLLLLLGGLFLSPPAGLAAEEQPSPGEPLEEVKISKEDQEIIKMMELLQRMDLLQDLDVMAASEEKQ